MFFLIKMLVMNVGILLYATYHDCDPVATKVFVTTTQHHLLYTCDVSIIVNINDSNRLILSFITEVSHPPPPTTTLLSKLQFFMNSTFKNAFTYH